MAKTEERMFDCSECINTPYMSGMCTAKRQLLMKRSRHVTYEKNDVLFEKASRSVPYTFSFPAK